MTKVPRREPGALPADVPPAQAMAHKLKTKAGRALYALCKQTVEPAFGIIKSFRAFVSSPRAA